jgi:hypothetical protein
MKIEINISDKDLVNILSGIPAGTSFLCKGANNEEDSVSAVLIDTQERSYVRCPRLMNSVSGERGMNLGKIENYCWMGKLDKKPGTGDNNWFIRKGDLVAHCEYCSE